MRRYTHPMSERTQRRLAAIVSADVVGYSRLMGADETGTLATLNSHRSELIDPLIEKHGGRIVKTTGDGLLLEFPSVVAAAECCVAVQGGMTARNAAVFDDVAMCFRVGLHLGDIIVEDDDIFGDGVNVAARLEALSEANGLALSDDAYRQVRDRMEIDWRDGGEHEVKNIARPVHVWHWSAQEQQKTLDAAAVSETLALPDKPSIAVLPFDNMSGDPEQEYFSDGITEDIITALSKVRWLFVIARNSTFTYKGQAVDVKRVSEELGVRYVLEGSTRKAGNRVRITAQLIDATNGNQFWAERYDRSIEDIFALQDEITQTIVSAIEPELGNVERMRLSRKPPENMDAWECYQRGMGHVWRAEPEDLDKAQALFKQALKLLPDYGPALAGLAYVNYIRIALGIGVTDETTTLQILSEGIDFGRRAIAADDRDYFSYIALARVLTVNGEFEEAIDKLRFSLGLNPNAMHGHHALGVALTNAGQPDEALPEFEMALRLSPMDPYRWATKLALGNCYYFLREYSLAEEWLRKSMQDHSNNMLVFSLLAATLAQQGRSDEAKQSYSEVLKFQPDHSIKIFNTSYQYKNPDDRRHMLEGLVRAGMPEE